jgi:hypothetical protein
MKEVFYFKESLNCEKDSFRWRRDKTSHKLIKIFQQLFFSSSKINNIHRSNTPSKLRSTEALQEPRIQQITTTLLFLHLTTNMTLPPFQLTTIPPLYNISDDDNITTSDPPLQFPEDTKLMDISSIVQQSLQDFPLEIDNIHKYETKAPPQMDTSSYWWLFLNIL